MSWIPYIKFNYIVLTINNKMNGFEKSVLRNISLSNHFQGDKDKKALRPFQVSDLYIVPITLGIYM